MAYPVPRITKQHDATILTYELSERTHSTVVYPLQAPNGSSVILYAHNAGLSVTWRGGRPPKVKQNGNLDSDPNAMTIDSDGDSTQREDILSQSTVTGRLDSGQEEPASVIAQTTVEMDVTPLQLSVPPLTEFEDVSDAHHALAYCRDNIVVSAACADGSVRLLSIPNEPTSSKRQRANEQIIVFSDDSAFRTPAGVTMSFTSHDPAGYSGSGYTLRGQSSHQADEWDFLVAWHSVEPVAALSVAAVSLDKAKTGFCFGKPRRQTYYLAAPLTSLSFNPSTKHFHRHKQLLAADFEGVVRICTLKFVTKTSPSGNVHFELARWPDWTGTFYVPFASGVQSVSVPNRKNILGAEWALDGRCAIVLLQDATWGLWDFEGARPELSGSKLVSPAETGIIGGGVTSFALRGNLESKSRSSSDAATQSESSQRLSATDNRLAPMTPNTRKAKQNVFLDKAPSRKVESSRAAVGGVSVSRPAEAVTNAPYETIVFWHNESIYTIPNLMLYWQRAAQSSSNSAATASQTTVSGPSPIHLDEMSTLGEPITSIAQFPAYADDRLASRQRLEHDFVVEAEHRQIFLCPPRLQLAPMDKFQAPSASALNQLNGARSDHGNQEQLLLARGQLGLAGLDRMLDDMDTQPSGNLNLFGQPARQTRRVGFAQAR